MDSTCSGGPANVANRKRIANFALKSRLPSMYGSREAVDAGGLMSYGADIADSYRRVAYFVDRILKGAKPADLPVEQPTKFEFVINLKTAKQIGLTIPPEVLARANKADQVRRGECQVSNDKWIESREKIHEEKNHVPYSLRYALCALLVPPTRSRQEKSSA